jgi:hypothetical protein
VWRKVERPGGERESHGVGNEKVDVEGEGLTESGVMCHIQEVRDLPERRGKGSEERMRERR